jgi:HK97 family phage prohead protease
MTPAGYWNPVILELTGIKTPGGTIPALLNHDIEQPIGQTDSISIDSAGIQLAGMITGEDAAAQQVISHAKNGFKWQASIGASIVRQEFLKSGEKTTVNGREVSGPMVIVREARLKEISFTPLGADENTAASVAASSTLERGVSMNFEQWLAAMGLQPATLTEAQRRALETAYNAEQGLAASGGGNAGQGAGNGASGAVGARGASGGGAGTGTAVMDPSLEAIVADQRRESDRIQRITQLTAEAIRDRRDMLESFNALGQSAIQAGTSVQEFDLNLNRLFRRLPPGGASRGDRHSGRVLEAVICRSGKLNGLEDHFDAQTLNAADRQYPHGIGLRELLLLAAREHGYQGPTSADLEGILRAAFRDDGMIRANDGTSTISLPNILSNVANKFLLQSFNAVESGWREFSSIRSVRDFKQNKSIALTGGFTYEKVGPAGELKHATIGEVAYTNQADTYGKMFAISRQDIINDDLGALTEIPMKLGRGAALKLNLAFWTAFLATGSPAFFSTAHANVVTGAGSALTFAGLDAANQKFKKQTDPDGNPLALTPKYLVVPTELETTADVLMTSMIVNTGGSSTKDQVPNANIWKNKFQVVVSSYLSNANLTNNSATAWYLVADPADLPMMSVAFLNGRETPIVESADADFNTLGIQMRGYHDWGTAQQEYRAAVRAAGV